MEKEKTHLWSQFRSLKRAPVHPNCASVQVSLCLSSTSANWSWCHTQKRNPRVDFLQARCQVESPIRRDMQISSDASGFGWPFHWTFHQFSHLPSHVMYKNISFPNEGILKWSVSDRIGVISTSQITRYHYNSTIEDKIKSNLAAEF